MAVHEQQGRSVSLLVIDQQVQALFAVADTLRPGMPRPWPSCRPWG
jgi:cation transport ATPase